MVNASTMYKYERNRHFEHIHFTLTFQLESFTIFFHPYDVTYGDVTLEHVSLNLGQYCKPHFYAIA